jgi:catechol 2,3-dioxygenase-like lactoylglutathione lyase family enzyme
LIQEFNHVGVRVRNAEQTVKFYTELLGGKVVSEAHIPSTDTKCIYLQVAAGLIEFLCPARPSAETRFGLDHVAFLVDDLDAAYERLSAAGFAFSVTPRVAGTGRGRLAFLSDPNGVRVELIQRDETFRIPTIEDGPIRSVDHISLQANDLAAAEQFYTQHMSMEPLKKMVVEDKQGSGNHLTISYLMKGNDVIELLHRPVPKVQETIIGHIALRVDSVDEMTDYLRTKGVQFTGSPKPAGNGYGRVVTFLDPDGVKIELLDRKDLRDL